MKVSVLTVRVCVRECRRAHKLARRADDATGPACLVRALLEQPVGAVVAAPSARALFAAVNAFPRTLGRAGVPERVMQALLAARQLPELPALLDALAMACASDGEPALP